MNGYTQFDNYYTFKTSMGEKATGVWQMPQKEGSVQPDWNKFKVDQKQITDQLTVPTLMNLHHDPNECHHSSKISDNGDPCVYVRALADGVCYEAIVPDYIAKFASIYSQN